MALPAAGAITRCSTSITQCARSNSSSGPQYRSMVTGSVRSAIAEFSISGRVVSRRRGFWGSGGPIAIK